ncbi:MAG: hypothetical protein ACYDCC_09060 [Actinomycetota bacterium]
MSTNGNLQQWSGPVPKPSAVLVLQVVGIISFSLGAIGLIIGLAMHLGLLFALSVFGVGISPFALASGWARPIGMMLGIVALSFLIAFFPVGTIPAAIVGFLAIKNREHVRDYYSQKIRRKLG